MNGAKQPLKSSGNGINSSWYHHFLILFFNSIIFNNFNLTFFLDYLFLWHLIWVWFKYLVNFHSFVSQKALIICAAAKLAPTVRLNNGYEMPVIGLGTFEVRSMNFNNKSKIEHLLMNERKYVVRKNWSTVLFYSFCFASQLKVMQNGPLEMPLTLDIVTSILPSYTVSVDRTLPVLSQSLPFEFRNSMNSRLIRDH